MEISTPQKVKLLKLMELLRENSDGEHPLKQMSYALCWGRPESLVTAEH